MVPTYLTRSVSDLLDQWTGAARSYSMGICVSALVGFKILSQL